MSVVALLLTLRQLLWLAELLLRYSSVEDVAVDAADPDELLDARLLELAGRTSLQGESASERMYKSNGRLNLVIILTKVTKIQGDHDGQRLRFVGCNWVVPLSAQFSLDLGAEMTEQVGNMGTR